MTNFQYILLIVFIVSTIVGYLIINKVPSLLHTPLMSSMNALSGVTILGAIAATYAAVTSINSGNKVLGYTLGILAITLAMINVVGGFAVTHRMLKIFNRKKENADE